MSQVQYLGPKKKECDDEENRQSCSHPYGCDKQLHYSICKERPQRDKKKEHWCGVGQGSSDD